MRRGPPRCRSSGRDELGPHLSCSTERGIVEDGEIFLDRPAGRIRRQAPSRRVRSLASARIKLASTAKRPCTLISGCIFRQRLVEFPTVSRVAHTRCDGLIAQTARDAG